MSIFRIYPSKSNTIAGSTFSSLNSGQNAVTDLWYGGGGTDTAPDKRNSVSRFMINFDLSSLQQKISNKEINDSLITSYKLKLKNSKPRDLVLEDDYEYDILFKKIATSFDLICFPVNKYWEEGRGYDLTKEIYIVKQKGNAQYSGVSNWNYATSTITWDQPGIFTNPTASTSFNSTQHFDKGDEDIDMDITDIVRDWLSGGSENYGLAIAYRRDYELLSTNTRYICSFFTEKTNTAFKPYIEVSYNQVIQDDRKQITNNRPSNLFLYTFSGHNFVNIINISAVTVDIKKGATTVYSGLIPSQLSTGVYYINVWMSAATIGEKYTDVWNNISFSNYDNQNIEQTFQIQKNYFTSVKPSINEYVLETYGIEQGMTVFQNEKLRVYCDLRVSFSIQKPSTPYSLQYRLIMNNQTEIIPWTEVNQAVIDDCKTNYFDIDASWLLHNQTYQINFKISEMGTNRIMPEKIDLKVLKPF
jgi:hypothetical protein